MNLNMKKNFIHKHKHIHIHIGKACPQSQRHLFDKFAIVCLTNTMWYVPESDFWTAFKTNTNIYIKIYDYHEAGLISKILSFIYIGKACPQSHRHFFDKFATVCLTNTMWYVPESDFWTAFKTNTNIYIKIYD